MKTKVTEKGLLIPKDLLEGFDEVEVRKESNRIVIVPLNGSDPIFTLGRDPVVGDVEDASVNLDQYLYGS